MQDDKEKESQKAGEYELEEIKIQNELLLSENNEMRKQLLSI